MSALALPIAKARPPRIGVELIRRRAEAEFKRRMLAAIRDTSAKINLGRAMIAYRAGSVGGVMAEVPIDEVFTPALRTDRVFLDTYQAAGERAARVLRSRLLRKDVDFSVKVEGFEFGVLNDRGLRQMQQHAATQVRFVSEATKEGLRALLAGLLEGGATPREAMLAVKARVGLLPLHQKAVANLRAELTEFGRLRAPTDAQRALFPNLIDPKRPVTAARIDGIVARYTNMLHEHRASNIARTEGAFAAGAGQLESWEQAADEGLFKPEEAKQEWSTSLDAEVRDTHATMEGQLVGMKEAFVTGDGERLRFPGDSSLGASAGNTASCRCVVNLVFEEDQDETGGGR